MIGKRDKFWGGFEKQSALKPTLRRAADCTRGGFRQPETHDRQQWTAVLYAYRLHQGRIQGDPVPLFLAKSILFFTLYTMSEKNIFEIEFDFIVAEIRMY